MCFFSLKWLLIKKCDKKPQRLFIPQKRQKWFNWFIKVKGRPLSQSTGRLRSKRENWLNKRKRKNVLIPENQQIKVEDTGMVTEISMWKCFENRNHLVFKRRGQRSARFDLNHGMELITECRKITPILFLLVSPLILKAKSHWGLVIFWLVLGHTDAGSDNTLKPQGRATTNSSLLCLLITGDHSEVTFDPTTSSEFVTDWLQDLKK